MELVLVENGIQIIYGNRANLLKIEMREFLKHAELGEFICILFFQI